MFFSKLVLHFSTFQPAHQQIGLLVSNPSNLAALRVKMMKTQLYWNYIESVWLLSILTQTKINLFNISNDTAIDTLMVGGGLSKSWKCFGVKLFFIRWSLKLGARLGPMGKKARLRRWPPNCDGGLEKTKVKPLILKVPSIAPLWQLPWGFGCAGIFTMNRVFVSYSGDI